MFSQLSEKWKSVIASGGIIAVLATVAGVGYKARAMESSKVDFKVFADHKEKEEKRVTKLEARAEVRDEDIKLIKEQLWMVAIATHAAIVVPKPETDGGVK